MEIIFDCPHCNQELSVDAAGAGEEIKCPTCGENLTIPEKSTKAAPTNPPAEDDNEQPRLAPSAIASSAAAKVAVHLKVPMRDKPGESLIKKSAKPLSVTAKSGEKELCVRTIRRDKCIESGHDKFDETVAKFLVEIGEANIVGIHPISFEHFDVQTQKIMADFGLIIIYRG
jgi:hypothetical protein